MKVVVTGATGFVGRHVVDELLQAPGVQLMTTSRDTLPQHDRHTPHLPWDLAQPPANAYDAFGRPDVIVHLAWHGLPNYASLHHFERELPQQYAFLKSLIEGGARHVLVAGTCFEYGMTSGRCDEEIVAEPTNAYALAKQSLRLQLEALRRTLAFELTWARLFYMYGDGQSPNSLFSQIVAAGARGEQRLAMSGGEQLRDFLPVQRVAQHLVALALDPNDKGCRTVNVCSGQPRSVRSFAEAIVKERGFPLQLDFGALPYATYEPFAFWGNPARLRSLQPMLFP